MVFILLILLLNYRFLYFINKFRLKSDLHYKSKVVDDMQTQMKELRQLHTSGLVMNNDHSKILEKVSIKYN